MENSDRTTGGIAPVLPIPTDLVKCGKPKQELKGILFDIYGTLFISGSGDIGTAKKQSQKNQGMAGLLEKYHIPQSPEQIQQRLFSEIEAVHSQLKQQGVDYPEVEIDKIWMKILAFEGISQAREFAEAYEVMVNPVYPMPHLREVLCRMKAHGMVMGIISNAQFYTPLLFTGFLGALPVELGFRKDLLFYSYQLGYAKPSAYMFRKASDALQAAGISNASVLYVGNDMLNDILPARKEGFQTALFAGDRRSLRQRKDDHRVAGLVPDMVITDLIQLLDYI